ncbi:MAG TPA: FAD-binding oxidoreductase [Puia sp.]|nr:FAD-binding oxidoreductase [Puia sp.]
MRVDMIVIGQGISGTLLGHYLEEAGLSFLIIDEPKLFTASKTASGIINPITGRRMVKTWMTDELMNFSWKEYQSIGNHLNISCISEKKIIDFFPSAQMRLAFIKRHEEQSQYLYLPSEERSWEEYFTYEFGFGEIAPCYLVDVQTILSAYRKKFVERQQLSEEHFSIEQLVLHKNKINYRELEASRIIFCDGIGSYNNPYFKNLPFAPNKGEVLIIQAKDFPENNIYKKGINIVPWKDDLFWVGSSYEWKFQDDKPTELFRERTESILEQWIKTPFKIVDHFAAVRPATLERRPFVGFHPTHSNIGILNGMGTKGCSLAPYFAKQLVGHYLNATPIHPEADIKRFSRILTR